MNCSSPCDGAGAAVGVGTDDGVGLGVGVGFGVGVGLGDGVGAAVGAARAAVWVSEKQQASAMLTAPGRERGKRYNTVHRSRKEDCRHPQHKRKKSD